MKMTTVIASLFALTTTWTLPTFADASEAILVKSGTTYDTRKSDQIHCRNIVRQADDDDLPQSDIPVGYAMPTSGAGGVPGVAGGAIAGLIIFWIEEGKAMNRGEELCMRNLGYRSLQITPEETAAYSKLSPEKKKDWERDFLESDLQARIAALDSPPLVPRLPPYRDASVRFGGLDMEGLELTKTPVHEGDVVLTGKARRARTATLVTPVETQDGAVRVAAEPGTVFHQVDYRRQAEPLLRLNGATWCGPVHQLSNGNSAKDFYCFVGRDNGYEVFRPSGQPWLAGPYAGGFALPLYTRPITLEERAQDDLGPMDFNLRVIDIGNNSVRLAADVTHDGKKATVWDREIHFDKNKTAILPLWDKRLILTQTTRKELTVEFTADGDGHDWRVGRIPYQ
jgi:hypothetical protein